MPKTRIQKENEVKKMAEGFSQAKAVVLTSCDGLKVSSSNELRNLLRAQGIQFIAGKKTLIKRAAADSAPEISSEIDSAQGGLAMAFGSDEVAPAKILVDFAKGKEMKIYGGLLEGKFISSDKVKELASLPSKLELIAKTVGTIKAPLSGFVNVLVGNLRDLINVLNAVKESKN